MVELASRLADHPSQPLFVLFGEGPLLGPAKKEAAKNPRLKDKIFFYGLTRDAAGLARYFNIGVICSDLEGSPNILLEYMSLGVPCVSMDAGDAAQILGEGRAELVVPVGDMEALTEAVRNLLDDEELRKKLAATGRQRYEKFYTLDQTANAHFNLYREMLS